jgi:hypothetical protein
MTSTIPQKSERIWRLENGKSQSVVMASFNTGLSTIYGIKKHKYQSQSFLPSGGTVKDRSSDDIKTA